MVHAREATPLPGGVKLAFLEGLACNNENLGLPEDAPTKAPFEFVAEALKK